VKMPNDTRTAISTDSEPENVGHPAIFRHADGSSMVFYMFALHQDETYQKERERAKELVQKYGGKWSDKKYPRTHQFELITPDDQEAAQDSVKEESKYCVGEVRSNNMVRGVCQG